MKEVSTSHPAEGGEFRATRPLEGVTFDLLESPPLATTPLPRNGLPADPYYCDWAAVVGGRIRRLRQQRRTTLREFGSALDIPGRGHYSAGFMSRLERGRANAPFYVYLAIADALDVAPGVLLGPDSAGLDVSEGEAELRLSEPAPP